jgi:hypothetical protein
VKTKAPFEDIASDSFAYNAANWAYNKGIFTGYNCTAYMQPYKGCKDETSIVFNVSSNLTRGQITKVLKEYSKIK